MLADHCNREIDLGETLAFFGDHVTGSVVAQRVGESEVGG